MNEVVEYEVHYRKSEMGQIMWDDSKWNTVSNYLGRREYNLI